MNIPVLMGKKWLLPALVVGVIVIGAVAMRGSGQRGADMDGDGEVNIQTEDGEWSTGGGLPSGWPDDVPVYAGAKVQQSASANPATGESGLYLALQSDASASAVAEYYRRELPAKGWTISGTGDVNGGTYLAASKGDRQLSLAVSPTEGGSVIVIGVAANQ